MTGDCRNCILECFMICAPHQIVSGCQIKEDKINRACGMHGERIYVHTGEET